MTELDCESLASTVRSIEGLTDVRGEDLRRRLRSIRYRSFRSEATRAGIECSRAVQDVLWRMVFGDTPQPKPSVVFWFHATRVPAGTNFAEGLLSLPEAAARLERLLGPPQPDAHFRRKLDLGPYGWGPFGSLVKEVALAPVHNHFLEAPESVVDLGYDLQEYRRATLPCIVKFRTRDHDGEGLAALALYYCFLKIKRQGAGIDCSTTWSGNGRAVPLVDIERIEFLASGSGE